MKAGTKYCLIGAGIVVVIIAVVGAAFLGLINPGGARGPSELPTNPTLGVASGNIPEPLKAVFNEAGARVQVPPALLAAISSIECGELWGVDDRRLTKWATTTVNIAAPRKCTRPNRSGPNGAMGPMQFIATTWGVDHPYDSFDPIPTPKQGSPGDQAGNRTGHKPASVYNIRDAVYGSAVHLLGVKNGLVAHVDEFKESDWGDEQLVRGVALVYCHGNYTGRTSEGHLIRDDPRTRGCRSQQGGYAAGVLDQYRKYSQSLSQSSENNVNP